MKATDPFYDYTCMPQGQRTPDEQRAFSTMLANVNWLYLGCYVLVLMERSFLSRFWTQFEAWLAFQKATADGLVGATQRRCRIEITHDAPRQLRSALNEEWGGDALPSRPMASLLSQTSWESLHRLSLIHI